MARASVRSLLCMHGMRSLLVLFVAAFVGCGGGDETLPAALSGVFHTDAVDAVNLRIDDDGTFQWKIYGCGFGSGRRWRRAPRTAARASVRSPPATSARSSMACGPAAAIA